MDDAPAARLFRGLVVDWPTGCSADGAECPGVRVRPDGNCWAHLSPDDRRDALNLLAAEPVLDIRGTVINASLLDLILVALHDRQSGRVRIKAMRAQAAEFSEGASFNDAWFEGDAWFDNAKFSRNSSFSGAEFKGAAGFIRSEFSGDALFVQTRFGGASSFSRAKLGAAHFTGAKFNGESSFEDADLRSDSWFEGAEFAGDSSFAHVIFGASTSFKAAEFHGTATFANAGIGKSANFEQAEFFEDADFSSAIIKGKATFHSAFHKNVNFSGVTFDDSCWIYGGSVEGRADFDSAQFGGETVFHATRIAGNLSFVGAAFSRDARFPWVTVGGKLDFEGCRMGADFILENLVVGRLLGLDRVRVTGQMYMVAQVPAVYCASGYFGERVSWSLWDGELWLTDSAFAGPATVESSLEPVTVEASGKQSPECPLLRLRSLRGTDAEQLTLIDVDLGRCLILGLRRPDLLRLGGRSTFALMPRGLCLRWRVVPWRWTAREALFEEHIWRSDEGAPARESGWNVPERDKDGDEQGAVAGPPRLVVLYRQLRLAVEAGGNEPGAADLYFGEMEMRRLAASRRGERWLLWAYWLVSGYGLRAGRALAVLAVIVLASAIALQNWGFSGHASALPTYILFAAGSVVSLDLRGHLPQALTEWGEAIRLVVRVAGPVLLGLAVLAVRGRVKR